MTPPRVLVVARPAIGGAGRVVDALLRLLPARGVCGTAVLSGTEGTGLLETAEAHGWETVRLDLQRSISPVRDAHAGMRLRRLARGHDLVHAHAAKAGALARVALPLRKGIPVVYAPHGFYFTYHERDTPAWRRYLGLEQRLAPRTTMLHCVSTAERDVAVEYGLATEEACHVLPNPVPPPGGSPHIDLIDLIDDSRPVVLMAARLAPPKDPLTFVRAAALCAQALAGRGGVRFVLIGDGPLAADVHAAPESAHVEFLPADAPVRALLRRASVAVLTTGSEALPLFLVEALAEGVPIVATDLPGCRDACGDAARYVPHGDPTALAGEVLRVLTEPDLRAQLTTVARERAPLFEEERWADGVVTMYERVLHRL